MRRRVWLRVVVAVFILVIIAIFSVDYWVKRSTREQLYNDIVSIPHNKVGLLLGTNKSAHGYENLYYKYRIEAAVALFKAGKIDYILISGDNGHKEYNEPEDMQQSLLDAGIPAERIVLDYAGFRTLDSILRCLGVFGEDQITVISQRFHNERALFIANRKDMHAIGYNARDVPKNWSWRVRLREKFARVKMLLDIVFNKQPHFYGPKIEIDAEKAHEYPLKEFTWDGLALIRKKDSTHMFEVIRPAWLYKRAMNVALTDRWLSKHPNAMVKAIISQLDTTYGGRVTHTFCWIVAGRDTLNNMFVKNGCFKASEQLEFTGWPGVAQSADDSGQYKVYVDTLTFNKFTAQINNAEAFAKQNKLGIWHE